jgi:membrane-associated phospholipid phosphatase
LLLSNSLSRYMLSMMYLKMPQPLIFLGGLLILVAVPYIIDIFRHGYLSGVTSAFIYLAKKYKWYLGLALVFIFCEIRFFDLLVSEFCKNNFNQNIYSLFDFFNSMGEGWFLAGGLFAAILIFDYIKKYKLAILMRISMASLICSGILNTVLKCLFNRERPGIEMNPYHFFHFFQTGATDFSQLIYASNSMPSGHTIAVFSTVTPLLIYTNKTSVKFLILLFALIICVARIYTLNHWLSDVTTATILGVMIGIATYQANIKRLK